MEKRKRNERAQDSSHSVSFPSLPLNVVGGAGSSPPQQHALGSGRAAYHASQGLARNRRRRASAHCCPEAPPIHGNQQALCTHRAAAGACSSLISRMLDEGGGNRGEPPPVPVPGRLRASAGSLAAGGPPQGTAPALPHCPLHAPPVGGLQTGMQPAPPGRAWLAAAAPSPPRCAPISVRARASGISGILKRDH